MQNPNLSSLTKKTISSFALISSLIIFIFLPLLKAQVSPVEPALLSLPGNMLKESSKFTPLNFKGLIVHPNNPLRLDFIVNNGDSQYNDAEFQKESMKLIKYFLASLTIPIKEQWVNLSPYESNKIIVDSLGQTALGTDLLEQDYLLKQFTASLISPKDKLGKEFWNNVYKQAYEKYGTTDIPVETYNKVWIVPDKAVVYQDGNMVFVVDSHMSVMLEADYLAEKAKGSTSLDKQDEGLMDTTAPANEDTGAKNLTSKIIKEIIIPAIEKEVNEGKNFANMRQIYNSLILARWYQETLKQSIMENLYIDKSKINGINISDKELVEKIYNKYIEAYKKGVYNYIKEDYDPATQLVIPKKYFSGGFSNNFKLTFLKGPYNEMSAADMDNLKLIEIYLNTLKGNTSIIPTEAGVQGTTNIIPGGVDMDNIKVIDTGEKITFELNSKELVSIAKNDFGGFLPQIINVLPFGLTKIESLKTSK